MRVKEKFSSLKKVSEFHKTFLGITSFGKSLIRIARPPKISLHLPKRCFVDDKILVATNNYRASGGGGYEFLKGKPDHVGDRIIPIQSVLEDFLMARGPIRDLPHAEWSFAAPDEAEAFQELQRQSAPSSKSNSQESLKTKANQPT